MSYFLGSRLVTSSALVLVATAGNATFGATESRAQTRAEQALQIEEIMVTAQKREQGLQDVPVAVSALSSLYLDQRNIDNMDDIALVVPSFKFNAGTNDTFQGPTLRGVGTFGLASGLEPSVSFVVDGVVLARAAQGFFEFNDIERIEVLRGPQASLFGKNASAGVINIVSKAPSDTFEFEARANYEPETPGRLFKVSASASGPVVKDRLSARISGFYRDASPHITNVFNDERVNGEEVFGVRGKFLFTPNDNLDILLSGDYSEKDSNCCQQQLTQVAFPAVGFNAAPVAKMKRILKELSLEPAILDEARAILKLKGSDKTAF